MTKHVYNWTLNIDPTFYLYLSTNVSSIDCHIIPWEWVHASRKKCVGDCWAGYGKGSERVASWLKGTENGCQWEMELHLLLLDTLHSHLSQSPLIHYSDLVSHSDSWWLTWPCELLSFTIPYCLSAMLEQRLQEVGSGLPTTRNFCISWCSLLLILTYESLMLLRFLPILLWDSEEKEWNWF